MRLVVKHPAGKGTTNLLNDQSLSDKRFEDVSETPEVSRVSRVSRVSKVQKAQRVTI